MADARIGLLLLSATGTSVRTISWSGYDWKVRGVQASALPGPNDWSDSTANVDVVGGALQINIVKSGSDYICSEIELEQTLGYGKYSFIVNTDLSGLDPWAVLGIYTYDSSTSSPYRELDIEAAKWGVADTDDLQFTVQPGTGPQTARFPANSSAPYTLEMTWQAGQVYYEARDSGGVVMRSWAVNDSVPTTGAEHLFVNAWLHDGHDPNTGATVPFELASFAFTASATKTLPKADTLSESFSSTPVDWLAYNGATISAGNAVLPCTSSYSRWESAEKYDLISSSTQIDVAGLPAIGNVSTEAQFFVWHDSSNYLLIEKIGSSLLCRVKDSGVDTDNYLTYNAVNHRFWRIEESAGNALFRTSADGSSWTTQYTVGHTMASQLAVVQVRLQSGYYATETGPGDFLVAQVGTSTATDAPAGTGSGTGTAYDAAAAVTAAADVATSTGTALAAPVAAGVPAGAASGTGTAYDASVAVTAAGDVATATGSAPDPVASAGVPAGIGAGSGSAADAQPASAANADAAATTGTANDATASTGITWAWNAEGGVDQATIATSDTGSGQPWDTVVVGTGTTVKYEAASPLYGSLSMYVDVGATSASAYTQWILPAARATGYVGFGFRYSATFGGTCSIFSANAGSTARVRLQITPADKLRVLHAAGGVVWTSTTTLTPGTQYFASVDFTADVAGSFAVRLYDATGALLEDSGTLSADFAGTIDRVRFGSTANQTNASWRPTTFDGITFSTVGAVQAPSGAPAGAATGTGAAHDATVDVTAVGDAATATGAAPNGAASVDAAAGAGLGAGAASDSLSALGVNGDTGAGLGAAGDATAAVSVVGGTAIGSGSAPDGVALAGVAAGVGSGTAVAFDAQTTATATADAAVATGAANDATVGTSSSASAPAESAAGTATAYNAGVALTVNGGTADGAGAALDAVASAGASPTEAASAGAAFAATPAVGAAPGVPTGSGTANDPATTVTITAGAAAGAGTAYDASVTTVNSVNANADTASGTAAAFDATVSISAAADIAAGAGAAVDTSTMVTFTASFADGTGTAGQATPALDIATTTATATGAAPDPFSAIAAFLAAAAGTGEAFAAVVDIFEPLGAGRAAPHRIRVTSTLATVSASAGTGTVRRTAP